MTTTAVYRYVGSKAELVELMVDAAIGDPPAISGEDWQQRCRAWTSLLADRYAEHWWLCEVTPKRMPTQPRAYAWIDALVGAISGQVQADALRLALLLDSLVRRDESARLSPAVVARRRCGNALSALGRSPRAGCFGRPGRAGLRRRRRTSRAGVTSALCAAKSTRSSAE